MSRSSPSGMSYTLGPGPMTPAIRALVYTNIAVFVVTFFAPRPLIGLFGLSPEAVIEHGYVWQLVTYLFLHGDIFHILMNMLMLWMFGVELERRWGTRAFTRYYFITGIGAGMSMILVSLLPFAATRATYTAVTIGASGAIYGVLLAWAMVFPHRIVLFMMMFPLPARVNALLMGALAFFAAIGDSGGPVANVAHLGGLVVGWIYLKGPRDLRTNLRYRLTKWRMDRLRRRFDVHAGGRRNDWRDRIH